MKLKIFSIFSCIILLLSNCSTKPKYDDEFDYYFTKCYAAISIGIEEMQDIKEANRYNSGILRITESQKETIFSKLERAMTYYKWIEHCPKDMVDEYDALNTLLLAYGNVSLAIGELDPKDVKSNQKILTKIDSLEEHLKRFEVIYSAVIDRGNHVNPSKMKQLAPSKSKHGHGNSLH